MADDTTQGAAQPAPSDPTIPPVLTPIAQEQKAIAEIAKEAERKQLDESDYPAGFNTDGTVRAGGRYLVNGVYVNAEGKPHKNQKDS